ncbi:MAG: MltA domain-containing protein [Alphaproteobacteria bacterium]
MRRQFRVLSRAVVFSALFFLAACAAPAPPPEKLTLDEARFTDLTGWGDDRQAEALAAFLRSCPALDQTGASNSDKEIPDIGFGSRADWHTACADAKSVTPGDDAAARAFFEQRFRVFQASNNGQAQGLFTGYYVPELKGSLHKSPQFHVPLYRVPDDLITADLGLFRDDWKGIHIAGKIEKNKFRPYEDRAAIDNGALAGRNLEIVYVDDPIDAFFLHIQGSGRIALDDGGAMNIGYGASNGRQYVAIGKELVARGTLTKDDVTMQSIRAWLETHPNDAQAIMDSNPSYVFFREIKGDFPLGAEGVALTPERSLAVDHRFIPYGVPVWLDAGDPMESYKPLRRLMVAQDTGGAITGPVRGDIFFGFGKEAADRAGVMKQPGHYYLLLPKPAAVAEN